MALTTTAFHESQRFKFIERTTKKKLIQDFEGANWLEAERLRPDSNPLSPSCWRNNKVFKFNPVRDTELKDTQDKHGSHSVTLFVVALVKLKEHIRSILQVLGRCEKSAINKSSVTKKPRRDTCPRIRNKHVSFKNLYKHVKSVGLQGHYFTNRQHSFTSLSCTQSQLFFPTY